MSGRRALLMALRRVVGGGAKRAETAAATAPRARRPAANPISVVDNEFDAPAPPLRRHEGSWMVTSPSGEVRELFTEANVRKALAKGWKAESAGTYLGRINKGIREGFD